MSEPEAKKTGATPMVEEEIVGGEVDLVECKIVLLNITDGRGQKMVRFGVVVPGGDVRILPASLETKPATKWLRDKVLMKLGLRK